MDKIQPLALKNCEFENRLNNSENRILSKLLPIKIPIYGTESEIV